MAVVYAYVSNVQWRAVRVSEVSNACPLKKKKEI